MGRAVDWGRLDIQSPENYLNTPSSCINLETYLALLQISERLSANYMSIMNGHLAFG